MYKKIILILYFSIIILIISLLFISIINPELNIIVKAIFGKKHYIKFDDIDKVIIAYQSNGFSSQVLSDTITCEIEVTDKEFLNLIEKTYKNKIFTQYPTSILYKTEYKIVINDNIELCTSNDDNFFCLDYNGKWLNIRANKKIYDKMIEIIQPELDKISKD